MTYDKFFSADVPSFLRSPVREIFRKVDLNAICSFAGGYPAADTFPVDEIPGLAARVMEKYGSKALQYGATQGVPELREAIAARYGVPVSQVQITTSSQQGIDVCTRILVNPGDIVLSNDPTYLGALQSFRAYRAQVMSVADFCNSEHSSPAKFIYVIPDFNNPSGKTMTLQEREELVKLARELDVLIVEDSPYRELRYSGEPLCSIRELAPERTLQLGSFSKVFAPGFRLGWIIGPEELLEQIYVCKQCLDLCPPMMDQYLALEYLQSGALDRNLKQTLEKYRFRRDLMLSLLEKYMPEGVQWTRPDGGLFLWLTLPEGIDTVKMYDEALGSGVAYVAGSFFFVDGSHRNTMRLNFSFIDQAKMEPGVKLLSSIIKRNSIDKTKMFHFTGAGNNFVVFDGREGISECLDVPGLCRKYATDGLMILKNGEGDEDFRMEFFNPDGSGGMMCGNGGRCIVAFADMLGLKPRRADGTWLFRAPDGIHTAKILSPGPVWTVRLKMVDVPCVKEMKGGFFLNTGTRHFVKFVVGVDAVEIGKEGPALRWDSDFAPEGTNVNFVQRMPDGSLKVRTFEKGVEGETLACGTGLTASAIAAFVQSRPSEYSGRSEYSCRSKYSSSSDNSCHSERSEESGIAASFRLQCRRGDILTVDFTAGKNGFTNVYLTGPAEMLPMD